MKQSEDSEEEQFNAAFRPHSTPPLTLKNEEETLLFIKKACESSLKNYKTTLQVSSGDLSLKYRMNLGRFSNFEKQRFDV